MLDCLEYFLLLSLESVYPVYHLPHHAGCKALIMARLPLLQRAMLHRLDK